MKRNEKAEIVMNKLEQMYPDAYCELVHETPFQLLIATILSAQCTDVQVNKVTPALFERFGTPHLLGHAPIEEVEHLVRSTGFYKNKAKNIKACALDIEQKHGGEVPKTIKELTALAGVGRKTANVVLGNAFNINMGIVVDTHVKRISKLIGLTKHDDPIKVEKDLVKIFPQEIWTKISHQMIFLGRRTCIARRPQCSVCNMQDICNFGKKVS